MLLIQPFFHAHALLLTHAQMYESALRELQDANSINANSRALLSQLEENFSAASSQYEATLEVRAAPPHSPYQVSTC